VGHSIQDACGPVYFLAVSSQMQGSDRFSGDKIKAICTCCGRRLDVVNLGLGGAFVATDSLPRVDESVAIELSLDDTPPFRALGIVAWINSDPDRKAPDFPVGYGVRFQGLDMVNKITLMNFLRQAERRKVR
jgi:hypothetical protein